MLPRPVTSWLRWIPISAGDRPSSSPEIVSTENAQPVQHALGASLTFIIDGSVIDTVSRENITATRLGGVQLSLINALDESEMLVYEPEHTTDRSITIFTDTSCPYCSKLHAEIDELLDNGIRVRYLMFPRAGLGSESHRELESVWCADDPHTAMTIAKARGVIESNTCDNPIQAHIALAEAVGLRGTPLIYLDSGQSVPGYRPVNELVQMINASSPL